MITRLYWVLLGFRIWHWASWDFRRFRWVFDGFWKEFKETDLKQKRPSCYVFQAGISLAGYRVVPSFFPMKWRRLLGFTGFCKDDTGLRWDFRRFRWAFVGFWKEFQGTDWKRKTSKWLPSCTEFLSNEMATVTGFYWVLQRRHRVSMRFPFVKKEWRMKRFEKKQTNKQNNDSPVEEGGDVLRRVVQQALLDQELDALLGVHVELFPAQRQLLGPRRVFAVRHRPKKHNAHVSLWRFYRVLPGFHRVAAHSTGFDRVSLGFCVFHWVLLGFTEF